MPWREEARSNLPPPPEDEPPHLRTAILDEIEDHLECAMQRELRDTGDPAVAKRRVLAYAAFRVPYQAERRTMWVLRALRGKSERPCRRYKAKAVCSILFNLDQILHVLVVSE